MKATRVLGLLLGLALLALLSRSAVLANSTPAGRAAPLADGPIVIDHTCTDISQIPSYWLEQAKTHLLHYAHTSHGGQIIEGMYALYQQDPVYDFYVLSAPPNHPPTELPTVCQPGQLCIYDGQPGYDSQPYEDYIVPELYWNSPDGITRTRIVADTGLYSYSMWSWCGQQSENPTETVQLYLDTLAGLEADYAGMRFILMTGHTDGGSDTLERNNNMVRQYALEHNMVLYDFADIESYDPDGNYYPDTDDSCPWCYDWCAAHPDDCVNVPEYCAHSHPFNCKLKAQAFWWMMARLAGWPGPQGDFEFSVTPDVTSVYAIAVRSVVVTNTGTVGAVYDLAAESAWPAELSDNVISLEPGVSAAVALTVEIPVDAPNYAADVMTLTVAPQGGQPASVNLTTNAGCRFDFVPDSVVDISDVAVEIGYFGASNPYHDLDHSGLIDVVDIVLMVPRFGQSCP